MHRGLEIGPGHCPLPDDERIRWDHVLYKDNPARGHAHFGSPQRFHGVRWGTDPLPQGDGYYDEVYASHVIEHLDTRRVPHALSEAYRVLKPGGLIEVWTLDVRKLVEAYLRGECGDDWRRDNPGSDPFVWFAMRLFSYGPPDAGVENFHRTCFDGPFLRKRLELAGFERVERILGPDERVRGESHGRCEMGAIARKGK